MCCQNIYAFCLLAGPVQIGHVDSVEVSELGVWLHEALVEIFVGDSGKVKVRDNVEVGVRAFFMLAFTLNGQLLLVRTLPSKEVRSLRLSQNLGQIVERLFGVGPSLLATFLGL